MYPTNLKRPTGDPRVMAILSSSSPLSTQQVAERLRMSPGSTSSKLSHMWSYGLVSREWRKEYTGTGQHRRYSLWSAG